MPNVPEADDPVLNKQIEDALDSLDNLLANIPQPPIRLFSTVDLLRRAARLTANQPRHERHRILASRISDFYRNRKDGIPLIVLPEKIDLKLKKILAACEPGD